MLCVTSPTPSVPALPLPCVGSSCGPEGSQAAGGGGREPAPCRAALPWAASGSSLSAARQGHMRSGGALWAARGWVLGSAGTCCRLISGCKGLSAVWSCRSPAAAHPGPARRCVRTGTCALPPLSEREPGLRVRPSAPWGALSSKCPLWWVVAWVSTSSHSCRGENSTRCCLSRVRISDGRGEKAGSRAGS